ncbi:MAG: hypothetical protein C0597_17440, partial [Marinilabiliales bacterium]
MRKSLIIVIASFVIVVLLVNLFVDKPSFNSPEEKLKFVLKEKQNDRLDLIYLEVVAKDSLNIDNHYGLITSYFSYPPSARVIKEDDLINIYWAYTENSDFLANDIGFYSLGLISSMKKDYNNALIFLTQVNNQKLKYLNNSTGRIYYALEDYEKAEDYYKKAINSNGNLEGAYSNLIQLYTSQNRMDDLYELLKDRKSREYFPSQLKRYLYLSKFNLFGYFGAVFSHTYQNQNLIGFLGALLVMLAWLFYLRRIDIYEPEKWKNLISIFLL